MLIKDETRSRLVVLQSLSVGYLLWVASWTWRRFIFIIYVHAWRLDQDVFQYRCVVDGRHCRIPEKWLGRQKPSFSNWSSQERYSGNELSHAALEFTLLFILRKIIHLLHPLPYAACCDSPVDTNRTPSLLLSFHIYVLSSCPFLARILVHCYGLLLAKVRREVTDGRTYVCFKWADYREDWESSSLTRDG